MQKETLSGIGLRFHLLAFAFLDLIVGEFFFFWCFSGAAVIVFRLVYAPVDKMLIIHYAVLLMGPSWHPIF